jgi:hypothetical protein
MVMAKGVPVLVGLVFELYHGDFHTLGSRLGGHSLKELRCIPVCDE